MHLKSFCFPLPLRGYLKAVHVSVTLLILCTTISYGHSQKTLNDNNESHGGSGGKDLFPAAKIGKANKIMTELGESVGRYTE